MKTKHTELAAWRQSHFDELEATLKVLKSIRDSEALVPVKCPKCKATIELALVSAKDKIEASKGIGRLLSAMSPARTDTKKSTTVLKSENKPTIEELEIIEARLAA